MEVVTEFESLCEGLQDPLRRKYAEEQLINFRSKPECLVYCQEILCKSASNSAQFQASLALREAALRSWGNLQQSSKDQLRQFLFDRILRNHGASATVSRALMAVFAALLKIEWQPEEPNNYYTLFFQIISVANAEQPSQPQCVALQLLHAVVAEFSPSTASALDKTWSFHRQCKQSFQQCYLREITLCAQKALAGNDSSEADSGAVCKASLDLLSCIFGWDFRTSPGARMCFGQGRPISMGLEKIILPKDWFDILIDKECLLCLSQLLGRLKGSVGPQASAARNLMVMMSSVAMPDLASVQESNMLQCVISAMVLWISPVEAAMHNAYTSSADELLDACRIFTAVAHVHGSSVFKTSIAGVSAEQMQWVLEQLVELTRACVAAGGCREEHEGSWLWDVCDQLLDAWADLLVKDSSWMSTTVSPALQAAATVIFEEVVKSYLAEARQGAAEDEEEGEAAAEAGPDDSNPIHETFSRTAVLGRSCLSHATLVLGVQLQRKLELLLQASTTDVGAALEEVCWLVEMAAHLLADSGDGELPQLPAAVSAAIADPAAEQAVLQLSQLLLSVLSICLDANLKQLASPRLMEKTCWAVSRWAETYLMSQNPLPSSLQQAFGSSEEGAVVVRMLTSTSVTLILGQEWLGEVDLHRIVILRILGTLAKYKAPRAVLLQTEDWQRLIGKVALHNQEGQLLDRGLMEPLTRIICGAIADTASAPDTKATITAILHNAQGELLATAASTTSQADKGILSRRVLFLISIFCGAFKIRNTAAQPVVWDVFQQIAGPCLSLLDSLHTDTEVVVFILKFGRAATDFNMPYLSDKDAHLLIQWILQLLSLFQRRRGGQSHQAASSSLRKEAVDGMYRSLKHIIQTLGALIQREAAYLGPEQTAPQVADIAQAVVEGLQIILPSLDETQLSFPKLARSYFQLLADLIEIFPERILAFAGNASGSSNLILQTLQWGLASSDLDVLQPSLDALAAFMQVLVANQSTTGDQRQWPHVLAQTVLNRLIEEQSWQQFADHAADCLLPYISHDGLSFQNMFRQIWASVPAKEQARALQAVDEIVRQAQLRRLPTPTSKQEWRHSFGGFVMMFRELGRRC